MRLGVQRENILLCDRAGVIYEGRKGELDPYKARFAHKTKARTIADALVGADVFVGLSAAGAVTGEMVGKMADRPIIFALANPVPEILPEEVRAVRPTRSSPPAAATIPTRSTTSSASRSSSAARSTCARRRSTRR